MAGDSRAAAGVYCFAIGISVWASPFAALGNAENPGMIVKIHGDPLESVKVYISLGEAVAGNNSVQSTVSYQRRVTCLGQGIFCLIGPYLFL